MSERYMKLFSDCPNIDVIQDNDDMLKRLNALLTYVAMCRMRCVTLRDQTSDKVKQAQYQVQINALDNCQKQISEKITRIISSIMSVWFKNVQAIKASFDAANQELVEKLQIIQREQEIMGQVVDFIKLVEGAIGLFALI